MLIWFSASIFLCIEFCFCTTVDVKTSSGVVRGQTLTALNRKVNQFLGIPFALPPIKKLRFAKPEPIRIPIKTVIDATKPKHSCIQSTLVSQSEDCLVLNIWTANDTNSNSSLKPVMFWIYGGALIGGSIFQRVDSHLLYDGTALAAQDVVVVSSNYRLGTLGFLYGGEDTAPGNVGFYDQLLALKWVRDNIHMFGGDKDLITIFGESAGSWSVSAHILSPLSKGLFRRAILESGSLLFNRGDQTSNKTNALFVAKELAKKSFCLNKKSSKWLDCLRTKNANLIQANIFAHMVKTKTMPPLAIVGTEFLPYSPLDAFNKNKFNQGLDILAGTTKNDGSLLGVGTLLTMPLSNPIDVAKSILKKTAIIDNKNIINHYFKQEFRFNINKMKTAFYDFIGDLSLICPTYLMAKQYSIHSPNSNIFYYQLTYQSIRFKKAFLCEDPSMGICHGADIEFVFGLPLLYPKGSTKVDTKFSKDVLKMWTNFAKYGNPDSNWPKLIKPNDKYSVTKVKDLNPNNLNHIYDNLFANTCDGVWKKYFE